MTKYANQAEKNMSEGAFVVREQELIQQDIGAYLKRHEEKDLLRFLTAGSVDDGKSTLIGRLLYDSKLIYEDQLSAVLNDSAVHGTTGDDFDPALLTDGLRAEREQGITIDVAYRYFSTDLRSFIICDAPGHEQYTRNMATGASHCDLAIILIDARHGVLAQTKRHSFIASLLGIKHLVVAVNKMDAVDYRQERFREIRRDYEGFAARLDVTDIHFIPISALKGDNVVHTSENMVWFQGEPLLSYLENVQLASDRNLIDFRFPVQYVLRPDLNFRGFCGTVASGVVRRGDEVMVLPSGVRTKVRSIITYNGELEEAFTPMAVTLTLEDEVDVSRGSMLARPHNLAEVGVNFDAMLVWMDSAELKPGRSYLLKSNTQVVPATVENIDYCVDVNTMHRQTDSEACAKLALNDIARVRITLHRPLCFDTYTRNPRTGSFILIDTLTNGTSAAGMIIEQVGETHGNRQVGRDPVSTNINWEGTTVSPVERLQLFGHRPATLWLTGLSGSGKSTIARELEARLVKRGVKAYILDGDNVRHGLNKDLGFSPDDRCENIRRIAEVAKLMNNAGVLVITAFISPYRDDRANAREIVGDRFFEIFVDTPLEVCEQRDPKGLYQKVRDGQIHNFTGVDAPYEAPESPELHLKTADQDVAACVDAITGMLVASGVISGVSGGQ
ncbi:MAG: sulfate adenylyltransferase subunit CysN [Verrucomicrobiota bacterium]